MHKAVASQPHPIWGWLTEVCIEKFELCWDEFWGISMPDELAIKAELQNLVSLQINWATKKTPKFWFGFWSQFQLILSTVYYHIHLPERAISGMYESMEMWSCHVWVEFKTLLNLGVGFHFNTALYAGLLKSCKYFCVPPDKIGHKQTQPVHMI